MLVVFGLKAKFVDVETAFLYGNIEEEIFMEYTPGMTDTEDDDFLALNKCIYFHVQAVRQYHKTAVEILCKIGFNCGEVETSLFWNKYEKGVVFVKKICR